TAQSRECRVSVGTSTPANVDRGGVAESARVDLPLAVDETEVGLPLGADRAPPYDMTTAAAIASISAATTIQRSGMSVIAVPTISRSPPEGRIGIGRLLASAPAPPDRHSTQRSRRVRRSRHGPMVCAQYR